MPDGRSACEHGVTCCPTCDPADYMGEDEYDYEYDQCGCKGKHDRFKGCVRT